MEIPLLQSLILGKPLIYLIHRSEGRLRLRGSVLGCPELLEALLSIPSVQEATFNPITETLLVLHRESETEIMRAVWESLPSFQPEPGPPRALKFIRTGLNGMNQAVYHTSRGWLDARLLIPACLGVYGLNRLILERKFRMPASLTMVWWSYATLWNLSQGDRHVAD